jgi:ferredoxin
LDRIISLERLRRWEEMKSIVVEDTCVACGTCVSICPEVFDLPGDIAVVKEGADMSLDDQIVEAAEACPVEAIKYEK